MSEEVNNARGAPSFQDGSDGKSSIAGTNNETATSAASTAEAAGSSTSDSTTSPSKSKADKIQDVIHGLCSKLKISSGPSKDKTKILEENSLEAVAAYIKSEKCKNIVVMAGAGISTSAGIPDFRSPDTGIYQNIQKKYNLLDPQIVFEISFFRNNPEPFYALAKELVPVDVKPTPSHCFIKLLHDKGLLLRHYTQNIDGLEKMTGVPVDKVVEAHGSFHTSHCLNSDCQEQFSFEWMREQIRASIVPKCSKCDTVVKPDVVFFGENLPPRFFHCAEKDLPKCDLLIVMGTSLVVQPFASLVDKAPGSCPRLLINREKVGVADPSFLMNVFKKLGGKEGDTRIASMLLGSGFDFESELNRDVALLGDCDAGVEKLVASLGWESEFKHIKDMNK